MRKAAALLGSLTLVGCATSPDKIAAIPVPDAIYEGKSCPELRIARAEMALQLATLSQQQSSAVTGDTVGVLMVGLPLSSMGGNDVGPKVAESKGRLAAIDKFVAVKKCPVA